ncbi:uncharacterized protein LOC106092182 [Stomoxys calcitrans]|uniref:Lipocalin/cytosolic fatty-acid binding domain-containing protein n=1 Tax=Stomoxys calcitrans TaxID=35570 RepID=A0A1I8QBA5_STOCA|nr:uncharacterized protein LOC106092182 [Stomoxys calcitrans]
MVMSNFGNIGIVLVTFVFVCAATGNEESLETYVHARPGGISGSDPTEMRQHHPPSMLCMDIKPQHSVDIKQIIGIWHGNEIIMHTQDIPGVYRYDSCITFYLSDVTEQLRDYYQPNYRKVEGLHSSSEVHREGMGVGAGTTHRHTNTRYLRLIWNENDDNIEYNFNYTMNHPGLWTNVGEQRGSMVARNKYNQFSGTVQVVKAVGDHLVLTFCSSDIHHSIYTVVLSREEQGLGQDVIRSIRGLLSRRGLYTESIRQVCVKSSAMALSRSPLLVISSVLLLVLICISRKVQ